MARGPRPTWSARAGPETALADGARVAVMGGGPAGAFFAYFVLSLAERAGLEVVVEVFEPRDFGRTGPPGCNMCGGIISESLVQLLAAEGITLPPSVIQRGIDSYVLHTDAGSVRIATPLGEKRIGTVHRGGGPKRAVGGRWESFDAHLLGLAAARGASVVREAVTGIARDDDGRPVLTTKDGGSRTADLLAVASGINSTALKLFPPLVPGYAPPRVSKTAIREFHLGEAEVERRLGSAMHVFLLDIPRLEFAAIIPKGEYVTAALLGEDIDADLVRAFLSAPETRRCFPPGWEPDEAACQCWPNIAMRGATQPWGDRVVFVGDCGVTRLYKDGIGAAYRAAKAAAAAAVLQGVSAADFARHYGPVCRAIERDNALGRLVFFATSLIQRTRFTRRALVGMVAGEQRREGRLRRMSTILWDMFTGSAPYREALTRGFHPSFIVGLVWNTLLSVASRGGVRTGEEAG